METNEKRQAKESNNEYFDLAIGLARTQAQQVAARTVGGGNIRMTPLPEDVPLTKRLEILEKFVHDLASEFPPIKNALADLYGKIG